jgi:hypothetical protein
LEKEGINMLAEAQGMRLSRGAGDAYPPWFAVPAVFRASTNVSLDLMQCKDWVREAAVKLEALGALPRNWDSYGGSPLTQSAKDFTNQVLRCLEDKDLPTPAVVLGSRGTVQFEWRRRGKELEVDLGEGNELEYVKVGPSGTIQEEGCEQSDFGSKLRELVAWFLRG